MTDKNTFNTTVLFADVAGSSKLYKQVGDRKANKIVSKMVEHMAQTVKEHNGVVIKTIGDEVMAHFRDANDACRGAIALQGISHQAMGIKVGMAWGGVIEQQSDLFGQTVNDAAAVAKIARRAQIITTQAHMDQFDSAIETNFSVFDVVQLKGASQETTLYRIEWEKQELDEEEIDHTLISGEAGTAQEDLSLRLTDEDGSEVVFNLKPADTPFNIGRAGGACQLAISRDFVSRDHCHIGYRHGMFILVDHSTNGTHVTLADGRNIYLRRTEVPLIGTGSFAIGRQVSGTEHHVISFSC